MVRPPEELARAGNLSVLAHESAHASGPCGCAPAARGAEGLGDVVIRTQIDSLPIFVRSMGSGRKHNHGREVHLRTELSRVSCHPYPAGPGPKGSDPGNGCDQDRPLAPVECLHHLVLVGGENGAQQLRGCFFILHTTSSLTGILFLLFRQRGRKCSRRPVHCSWRTFRRRALDDTQTNRKPGCPCAFLGIRAPPAFSAWPEQTGSRSRGIPAPSSDTVTSTKRPLRSALRRIRVVCLP